MSAQRYRVYDAAFKRNVLRVSDGIGLSQLAKDLGISRCSKEVAFCSPAFSIASAGVTVPKTADEVGSSVLYIAYFNGMVNYML